MKFICSILFMSILFSCNNHEIKEVNLTESALPYEYTGIGNEYFESGKIQSETYYENGAKNGLCRRWLENGQLIEKLNFKNGSLHGLQQYWFDDGKLQLEQHFKDDKLNGVSKSYYENGKLKNEISYKENVLHGKYITFYENGEKSEVRNYKNGKLDGIQYYFDNLVHLVPQIHSYYLGYTGIGFAAKYKDGELIEKNKTELFKDDKSGKICLKKTNLYGKLP